MELPTYTNIWKIEKRLYKLYDFRLPMPLPVGQVAAFLAIAIPYMLVLALVGMPFSHTWVWLYVLPPGLLAWLVTRPVLEGKRLPELVLSQVRYLTEPRTWRRLMPLTERDQMVVVAQVWRAPTGLARRAPAAAEQPAIALPQDDPAAARPVWPGRPAPPARGAAPAGRVHEAVAGTDTPAARVRLTARAGQAGAAQTRARASAAPGRALITPARTASADGVTPVADGGALSSGETGLTTDVAAPTADAGPTVRAAAEPGAGVSAGSVQRADAVLAAEPGAGVGAAAEAVDAPPAAGPGAGVSAGSAQRTDAVLAAEPGAGVGAAAEAADTGGPARAASGSAAVAEAWAVRAADAGATVRGDAEPTAVAGADAAHPADAGVTVQAAAKPAAVAGADAAGPADASGPAWAIRQPATDADADPSVADRAGRAADRTVGGAAARAVPESAGSPPATRPVITVRASVRADRPLQSVERALRTSAGDWQGRAVVVPGGHRPGKPDHVQRDRARARQPVSGPARIVVLGSTAGAGQTVTTLLTGQLLASLRGEAVAVLDCGGAAGSLTELAREVPRLLPGRLAGAKDAAGRARPDRAPGLQVVTADHTGPMPRDAGRLIDAVAARYPLMLADPSAADVPRALHVADQLVIVTPASANAVGSLGMTLEWLEAHGHGRLAQAAVTVLNGVSEQTVEHAERAAGVAAGRCRTIVQVPWDARLPARGALAAATVYAYTALAGVLISGLADPVLAASASAGSAGR